MRDFNVHSLMYSGGEILASSEWSVSVFLSTVLAQTVGLIVLLQILLREKGKNLDKSKKHKLYGVCFILWTINCVILGDVFVLLGLEKSLNMILGVVWILLELWIFYYWIYKRL